jgi:membrane-bound lytic murein transglycosylase B
MGHYGKRFNIKTVPIILLIVLLTLTGQTKDYNQKTEVKEFIEQMVKKHGLNRTKLIKLFRNVKIQKRPLKIYRPKTKTKSTTTKKYIPQKYGSWTRYEQYLLKEEKIDMGVAFLHKHRETFSKVYKEYGVPPEYVAGIIGVESRYGVKQGTYPVFDTLTTLAFEKNKRSSYFKYELENLLLLARTQKINPKTIKGSYAGAIGLGQFMPSSYSPFAIDFNKDGIKSMRQVDDAIASVAHYLHKNGWKKWEPVAERVNFEGCRYEGKETGYNCKYPQSELKEFTLKYGEWSYKGEVSLIKLDRYRFDELWFAAHNFYVITRYNHNSYYAMVVHQLAQRLVRKYKKTYGAILR